MFAVLELRLDLEPNQAVFDLDGYLLGIPDLLDADAGLALGVRRRQLAIRPRKGASRSRAASGGQCSRGTPRTSGTDRRTRREE